MTTQSLSERLFKPVDNASVTFFRFAFGAMMVVEILYEYLTGNLAHVWANPPLHFYYAGFAWLPEWSGEMMYVHFAVTGICAFLIALGLFYRTATVIFAIGYAYIFLIEQAAYQNHLYLFCLVGILLVFLPLNKAASVDVRLGRVERASTTETWVLWLLRFQIGIVYFFGGIAKLNADWFAGEPMRMWLARRSDFILIGPFVEEEWLVWFFTFGGILFDLLIVGLLLWKRTRVLAFIAVIFFNLTNAFLFKIGPFPWVMLLATPIFFAPDWPRVLLDRFRSRDRHSTESAVMALVTGHRRSVIIWGVGVYVVWQLLMPIRPFLYANDPGWSDEAHFFSWRMMLRDKTVADARVIVHDSVTGQNHSIDPRAYMEPWQSLIMFRNPELIRQFSHYAADRIRTEGTIADPKIYARVLVSLNGRTPTMMIDPTVDMSRIEWQIGNADWIFPAPK